VFREMCPACSEKKWLDSLRAGHYCTCPREVTLRIKAYREQSKANLADACRFVAEEWVRAQQTAPV